MPFAMAKLALKWVFKEPATSKYPFEPRQPITGSRGKLEFDIENCIYCKICEKKCPTDALVVDRVAKTWGIDRLRCINCAACVEACPKKSLELNGMHVTPAVTRDVEFPGKGTEAKEAPPKVEEKPAIPVKLVSPDPQTAPAEVAQR